MPNRPPTSNPETLRLAAPLPELRGSGDRADTETDRRQRLESDLVAARSRRRLRDIGVGKSTVGYTEIQTADGEEENDDIDPPTDDVPGDASAGATARERSIKNRLAAGALRLAAKRKGQLGTLAAEGADALENGVSLETGAAIADDLLWKSVGADLTGFSVLGLNAVALLGRWKTWPAWKQILLPALNMLVGIMAVMGAVIFIMQACMLTVVCAAGLGGASILAMFGG